MDVQRLVHQQVSIFLSHQASKKKTFLHRSPQKVDSDMSNVLLRNQISVLEDELNYWKCRFIQSFAI